MGAQNKLFTRMIWLIDTVYSAGHIKMAEIDRKWARSAYNDAGEEEYGARNLHRHREAIAALFGIEIVCDRTTNEYSIGSRGAMDGDGARAWLVNTFAVNNMVNLAGGMKDRIIFEDIPEGARYLSTIVNAMKEEHQLFASYQGYKRAEPHSFLLAPYCLKVFKQRWYLVGKPEDHPEESEPRVYALDRMKDLVATDKPYNMPKDFKASLFFQGQYGIDRSITKPEKIVVKVTTTTRISCVRYRSIRVRWRCGMMTSLPISVSSSRRRMTSSWSCVSSARNWRCLNPHPFARILSTRLRI